MSNHLFSEFAVIKPDAGIDLKQANAGLYAQLDGEYGGFRGHMLVSAHSFSEDWDTWEFHLAGDELVVLISGRAQMVLQGPDGDSTQDLQRPRDFCLVPRGAWHSARIDQPTQLPFITPAEDTSNAAAPPHPT